MVPAVWARECTPFRLHRGLQLISTDIDWSAHLLRYFCRWLAMFWRVRPLPAGPMSFKIWDGTALSTPMFSTTDTNMQCSSEVHST